METRPGIEVDGNGVWLYRKAPIRNEGVLRYFKNNLHRDRKGYYILNRFGELREEAYLDAVRGFPIFVMRLQCNTSPSLHLQLRLDCDQDLEIHPSELSIYGDTVVGFLWKERGIPVRLSRTAMADLMDYLESDAGPEGEEGQMRLIIEGQSIPLQRGELDSLFEQ